MLYADVSAKYLSVSEHTSSRLIYQQNVVLKNLFLFLRIITVNLFVVSRQSVSAEYWCIWSIIEKCSNELIFFCIYFIEQQTQDFLRLKN